MNGYPFDDTLVSGHDTAAEPDGAPDPEDRDWFDAYRTAQSMPYDGFSDWADEWSDGLDHAGGRASWGFGGSDAADLSKRVTHLVYVEGRLVESWHEPARGTRWQRYAAAFERERRPTAPELTPAPPYERALTWLDHLCGGREAVLALTSAPLVADGLDLPDLESSPVSERLAAVAELLEAVAARCFDAETTFALRAALLRVYADEPEVVLDAASAARVAGGLCWAIGKANGLLRPQGELRIGRLQDELALTSSPSTTGKTIERALVGYRDRSAAHGWWRPEGLPDLLALGRPELLVGSVRARLVRVRDRALEAQTEAGTG